VVGTGDEIGGSSTAHLTMYPGYAVTADGRVWSFWRTKGHRYGNVWFIDFDKAPRELKQSLSGKYLRVGVRDENGKVTRRVHSLVLLGFSGPCPEGMEGRHLDGDINNNALSNLMYGTWQENHEDKELHGRVPRGEVHVNSRLIADDVIQARKLWKSGVALDELAARFGVNRATIHYAVTGVTWKQLDDIESPWKPGRWSRR